MRFEDFVDDVAAKARGEKSPGVVDRNAVLSRIGAIGSAYENPPGFRAPPWLLAISGVAAGVSLVASLEWVNIMSEPLGLLLGMLELMPWEVMS